MVQTIDAIKIEGSSGITEAIGSFSQKFDLIVTAAPNQLADGGTTIQKTNPDAHTFAISQKIIVANLEIVTPGQTTYVPTMSLEQLTLVSCYLDEATNVIN